MSTSTEDALQDHRIQALEEQFKTLQESHQLLNENVVKLTAAVKAISSALEDIKSFVIKIAGALSAAGVGAGVVGGVMF